MQRYFSPIDIKNVLPQRPPFLMIDHAEIIDDTHCQAIKNVTVNELFFTGHFPNRPIMPGVLQLEAMKQLAEIFFRQQINPGKDQDVYLKNADKVKFRRQVIPGDRIKIEVELTGKGEDNTMMFRATVNTASGLSSQALITLGLRPREFKRSMPEFPGADDLTESVPININKLMTMIPHRFPFLLVDHISKLENEVIRATKNLSINEPFFSFTAPDFPVIPEAFLCEILAQAGCASVLASDANRGKIGVFLAIDGAESFAPVGAGDQLVITSLLPPGKTKFGKGSGEIYCNGKIAFKASMMFAVIDE